MSLAAAPSALVPRLGPRALLWVAPLVAAAGAYTLSSRRQEEVIAGGVTVLLLVWVVRHPGPALSVMAVVAALQAVGFGFLYGAHVPAFALRAGGAVKDVIAIGILIAAVRHMARTGQRLDRLDVLALAYVAVVTLYLLLPGLFVGASAPAWGVRLLAWRLDAGYVLLFLALRRAPITERARHWFLGVVVAIGAVTAAFAVWQYASPTGFERFIVNTGHQVAYERNVLHSSTTTIDSTLAFLSASGSQLHLGSIFLSPFDMADYLVIVAAVIVERLARGGRLLGLLIVLGLVLFALFASQVRADALAVLVVVLVALLPAAGRLVLARWRLVLMVLIGAVLVVPALGGTRFAGADRGAQSSADHVREFYSGLDRIGRQPLGAGLGYNPVTSDRFLVQSTGKFTSDNSILQVGDELGVLAMLAWVPFVFGVLVALWRRARAPSGLAAAAGLALLGMLVAGLFHHVFVNFSTPWTLWPLAGLALADPVDRPGVSTVASADADAGAPV